MVTCEGSSSRVVWKTRSSSSTKRIVVSHATSSGGELQRVPHDGLHFSLWYLCLQDLLSIEPTINHSTNNQLD